MIDNIYTKLGVLAFGTRVKRLSDKLLEDVTEVYKASDIDFEPRYFVITRLLLEKTSMTISDIAKEMDISQPAISQTIESMLKKELITITKDEKDTRRKIVSLSPKCKRLTEELKPVWQDIEESVKELFGEVGLDVLGIFNRIETQLEHKKISQRVTERTEKRILDNIEIFNFSEANTQQFKELNHEWLNKYFRVEKYDEELLNNPKEKIIDNGGVIIFARYNDEIAGTCALIKHNDKLYELTKMAVTEKSQGKKIGYKLGLSIIEEAKKKGAEKLILETSRELVPAINLYKKLGFVQKDFSVNKDSKYERTNFRMELNLNGK